MLRLLRLSAVVALVLLIPSFAHAQASITGVVKDASGGVLPGVTVEAASPALIEKVRSAVTDSSGQYRIIDLRPGVYTVTFSLGGFSSVRREGLELSGSFVATLNIDLKVGELAETITVSGETPIVNLQSAAQQRVMTEEIVTQLPTAKSIQGLATLIPGVKMTVAAGTLSVDVGGSSGEAAATMSVHGSTTGDTRPQLNGQDAGMLILPDRFATSPNMSGIQEVTVDTSGADAASSTGGVRVNYIPKDGGNTFSGNLFFSGTNTSLSSDNLSQELKDRGLTAASPVKKIVDLSTGFGGPIKKDKLWFFGTFRYNAAQNYLAGLFKNKNHADASKWVFAADPTEQIFNGTVGRSGGGRLTWQATPRNKIAFSYQASYQCFCPDQSPTTAREASSDTLIWPQATTTVDWTAPVTSRFLLVANLLMKPDRYGFRPTVDYAGLIPVTEQVPVGNDPATYRGRQNFDWRINPLQRIRFEAAYVTGAHSFKVGFADTHGHRHQPFDTPAYPYTYTFNRGNPVSLTETAFEGVGPRDTMKYDAGIYAQDRWTVHRLTLNGGVRFDVLSSYAPEQHVGSARLAPTRDYTFPFTQLRHFRDVSPKTSAVYDLFGNGKTAAKVSLNRYVGSVPCCGSGNPVSELVTSAGRAWTDNGNFVPDCDLTNPNLQDNRATGGDLCGALTGTGVNFGKRVPGVPVDPAVTRGWGSRTYNWEFSTGVQHQLLPRIGLDVAYFRRAYGNQVLTVNRAVTSADYGEYCVTAPQDSRLPKGGGYTVCGLRDINPAKASVPTDNLSTFAKNFGGQTDVTQSVDVNVSARLANVLLQGGTSTARQSTDNCELLRNVPNAGNLAFCHAPGTFISQVKAFGAYTVPRIDLLLSAVFQSYPGPALAANYVVSTAIVAQSLGRPLSGNAATATVPLIEPRSLFGDRMNQFDLRVGKVLKEGRSRYQINLDLYNLFNAAPALTEANNLSNFRTPTAVLPPRLFKFGVQYDF
jgi:hypothetical protein